jgi:hypothetical protein
MPGYSSSAQWGFFVHNISANSTTSVDTSTSGTPANGPESGYCAAFSETGRYAALVSGATNLIDGSASPTYGMYMKWVHYNLPLRAVAGFKSLGLKLAFSIHCRRAFVLIAGFTAIVKV